MARWKWHVDLPTSKRLMAAEALKLVDCKVPLNQAVAMATTQSHAWPTQAHQIRACLDIRADVERQIRKRKADRRADADAKRWLGELPVIEDTWDLPPAPPDPISREFRAEVRRIFWTSHSQPPQTHAYRRPAIRPWAILWALKLNLRRQAGRIAELATPDVAISHWTRERATRSMLPNL